MSVRTTTASLALVALLVSSPSWAQQHIADPAAMQQAIARQQATDTANRQIVMKVLTRADVQTVAARMGMDVKTAETAVAQLTGDDLAQAASSARAIDAGPAAGSQDIVISTTTLLLIIILILLIAR
jgi:hypothetical protein